jgi:hypothetical protein
VVNPPTALLSTPCLVRMAYGSRCPAVPDVIGAGLATRPPSIHGMIRGRVVVDMHFRKVENG